MILPTTTWDDANHTGPPAHCIGLKRSRPRLRQTPVQWNHNRPHPAFESIEPGDGALLLRPTCTSMIFCSLRRRRINGRRSSVPHSPPLMPFFAHCRRTTLPIAKSQLQ